MLIGERRECGLFEVEKEAGFLENEWRETGIVAGERQHTNITVFSSFREFLLFDSVKPDGI